MLEEQDDIKSFQGILMNFLLICTHNFFKIILLLITSHKIVNFIYQLKAIQQKLVFSKVGTVSPS